MVNTGELLINVVTSSKPKMLRGLGQKGTVAGTGSCFYPVMDTTRYRRIESTSPDPVNRAERGKPVSLLLKGREEGRKANPGRGGYGGGKKRTPSCNGTDTGGNIPRRASALTSLRCGWTRALDEPIKGAMQMTAEPSAGAVSHLCTDWHAVPWQKVNAHVRRLQARIVQATKAGKGPKVHALQYVLTHSLSGKALAVRRVTENQGKNTPGVDKVTWQDPESKEMAIHQMQQRGYKALPLRRVSIPKPNGKQRPLGIPKCPAYGTPSHALWVATQRRASAPGPPSRRALPYAGAWRGGRCRTGWRKTARRSGVRVIQRGWCGAAWRDAHWPARPQAALVLTSPCRRAAAARAADRPASRGWAGGGGRRRGRAERQRSPWTCAAVTAPPTPAVSPAWVRLNASGRSVWLAARSRRRARTTGAVRRASPARRGRGSARRGPAWVGHRIAMGIVVARRVRGTSCMSKRPSGLRSTWGVVGACQMVGRSWTRASIRGGGAGRRRCGARCRPAVASRSSRATAARFSCHARAQRRATRRVSGSTARHRRRARSASYGARARRRCPWRSR
jgi:hypothetical protein